MNPKIKRCPRQDEQSKVGGCNSAGQTSARDGVATTNQSPSFIAFHEIPPTDFDQPHSWIRRQFGVYSSV